MLDFPFYTPARLAKRIATLDVLSNGRAVIGAGVGWSEDEFIASNVPFSQRSGRMTEMIHALNALWGPDPVEFHGKYYDVPATIFNPKPLQKPRPPLLLGGFAPAALKIAAPPQLWPALPAWRTVSTRSPSRMLRRSNSSSLALTRPGAKPVVSRPCLKSLSASIMDTSLTTRWNASASSSPAQSSRCARMCSS